MFILRTTSLIKYFFIEIIINEKFYFIYGFLATYIPIMVRCFTPKKMGRTLRKNLYLYKFFQGNWE